MYQLGRRACPSAIAQDGRNWCHHGRKFNKDLQDQLAHQLIEEAGLSQFKAGDMTQTTFMNNLAKIWAGLPTSNGKSYYHNYAGNRATVSWDSYKARMDAIFSS